MDTSTPMNQQAAMMHAMGPIMLIALLIGTLIYLVPMWQIVKKAGFAPALSLLMLIPMVNLVMLYVFAFCNWKVAPALRQD
jgi:hypothetical protein